MGESSRKTSLERHEEKIKEILDHLDKLSLDRIEYMEDKIEGLGKGLLNLEEIIKDIQHFKKIPYDIIPLHGVYVDRMPPKRTSTSEAPAMTQAAIRKLVADNVCATLEGKQVMLSLLPEEENKVTFATGTLTDDPYPGGMHTPNLLE
ncbi:hypothetical protein Tco_0669713 [Tanacetum coccineum]